MMQPIVEFSPWDRAAAVVSDAFSHPAQGARAVSFTERLPGEIHRELKELGKESATSHKIVWRMEFEKQQFAGLKCLKGGIRRWTPEINLRYLGFRGVACQPIVIRDGDIKAHGVRSSAYSPEEPVYWKWRRHSGFSLSRSLCTFNRLFVQIHFASGKLQLQ